MKMGSWRKRAEKINIVGEGAQMSILGSEENMQLKLISWEKMLNENKRMGGRNQPFLKL